MQKLSLTIICLIILFLFVKVIKAQNIPKNGGELTSTAYLNKKKQIAFRVYFNSNYEKILHNAINKTLNNFENKALKKNEIAATLIDLKNPRKLVRADYRGEEEIYPASVVKMFYMAALHRQLEDGDIKMTPELERGLKNMIVDSGNESTGYILDVLTQTSSGAELPKKSFKKWAYKRNAVNRYFQSLGYKNISINQKTHCEDAWGVEQQFRGYANKNRNTLTTNATARLMSEIVIGKFVNTKRSKQMMNLMKRVWEKPVKNQFYQEFISHALKPGTKLWSKEGFTSKTRHDAAYIETPDGLKFVLVIFTENHSTEQEIIPSITREIIKGLGEIKK